MGAQDDLDEQVGNLNVSLDKINEGVATLKEQQASIEAELESVEQLLAGSAGTADVDLGPLRDAVAKASATAAALEPAAPISLPEAPPAEEEDVPPSEEAVDSSQSPE